MKWNGAPWDEREMPEQHTDVPVILQDWDTFWDQVRGGGGGLTALSSPLS